MAKLEKGDVILYYGIKWKVLFAFEDLAYGKGYRIQALYSGNRKDIFDCENIVKLPKSGNQEIIETLYYD